MSVRHWMVGLGALAVFSASCSPGPATAPSTLSSTLTTRQVALTVSGNSSFTAIAPASADGGISGFVISYDSSSKVTALKGTLAFDDGTDAGSITTNLVASPLGMEGSVKVSIPSAGINRNITGIVSDLAADDHGDVSFSASNGSTNVSVATTSVAVPAGTNPELEALLAANEDFCAEAQVELAGLDTAEVPVSSIVNGHETPRASFAGSKSVVSPLTVRTWTEAVDITDGGEHRTVARHISCKMRAADHIATTGVTTHSPDTECSALNQKSIDLAFAQMTPAQQAAVAAPLLGSDVVRQTGAEWTTPLGANQEFDGTTLRAHALLTEWNDPAFALFPDTIRGVHYCTVWAPTFAYFSMLDAL